MGFWGSSFPRCRLKARKSPVSHKRTIPGFFKIRGFVDKPPIPGTGEAVTICRRFPCEIVCGDSPQLPPGGSWHAGGVTEGASGRQADGLIWGGICWWLSTPGYSFWVCSPIGFLQVLASRALLSCSGKKVSKEAGLRGKQLTPVRCFPLKNPP